MINVAIYSEKVGNQLVHSKWDFSDLPLGYLIRTNLGTAHTLQDSGLDEQPTGLVVQTLHKHWAFTVPKLVRIEGKFVLLSALSDTTGSGTLQKIDKYYILLEML